MLNDSTTILSEPTLALVDELRSVRETIKSLKAREDQIRQALLTELKGSSEGITASGVPVITIERQPRTRINGDRLQALYRDVWKDCQVESTVAVVRLPEVP